MSLKMGRPAKALVNGWREDPASNRHQLTHAVESGKTVATCGARVEVTGKPWSEVGIPGSLARCPTCAKAAALIALGTDYV
jgi:hypothetical protein